MKIRRRVSKTPKAAMAVHFSSKKHDWGTPPEFFAILKERFGFDWDLAATKYNALAGKFFSKKDDSLTQDWGGKVAWLNPPYGRQIGKWTTKALKTKLRAGEHIVMLVPARTDTRWLWRAKRRATVILLKGRLSFVDGPVGSTVAPFPSALLWFHKGAKGDVYFWDWKTEAFPL